MGGAGRWAWPLGLVLLFAGALGLRVWSLGHGLPYAYNVDEDGHFAPVAVKTAIAGWNPHYFENPPAFSYLLRVVFQVGWGKEGLIAQWAKDPAPMLLAARCTSAVLGSLSCVAVAVAGRRMFGRVAGMFAGACLAVACLPVAYGHFALNDVPALLPIAIALVAVAGLASGGDRWFDWTVAGLATGVAVSTKYTAGVVAVAIVCAAIPKGRRAFRGLTIAAVSGMAGFAVSNPYALLSFGDFRRGLSQQSDFSSQRLFGLWTDNPFAYYGDVAVWGFGLLPLLLAAVGLVALARSDRAKAAVLFLPPLALLASLSVNLLSSGEGQMYSRWLLPAFPFLALLAGAGAAWVVAKVAGRVRGGRPAVFAALAAAAGLLMVAQGLFLSVRVDTVLGRPDTRQELRDWMVAHVPPRSRVVAEAYSMPDAWYLNPPWAKPRVAAPAGPVWSTRQPFITALTPALLDMFRAEGRCLLIVSSNIRDRSDVDRRALPGAVAFYSLLDRSSATVFSATPWTRGPRPVFDFDRAYLYFDGRWSRPGPQVEVRRLDGCVERRNP